MRKNHHIMHELWRSGMGYAFRLGCKFAHRLNRNFVIWLCAVAMSATPAFSLDLRLTSGGWRPTNITIEDFENEPKKLAEVIRNDLSASGYFRSIKAAAGNYGKVSNDYLGYVRGQGGEYLLTGEVKLKGEKLDLFFELHDTLTESSLGRFTLENINDKNWRQTAHIVSNWIYEEVVRKAGVFHTKVAYVVREKDGTNKLRIADYDGYNAKTILRSPYAIISPTWTPDGKELLYVSFERKKPVIYRQSLLNGERRVVANFPGSNSSPSVSPDGQKIAMVLTENKHLQQIYIVSAEKKQRMRQGRKKTIDTEPAWSPDGRRIAFESDETGAPQIYEYNLDNGGARRLSFGSAYCVSPSYSKDGRSILHIRRNDNRRNNVAILDTKTRESVFLTDIREADSPSFSPNDAMVLYKDENYPNFLYIVAVNGIIKSRWKTHESGEIINPIWGPSKSGWY